MFDRYDRESLILEAMQVHNEHLGRDIAGEPDWARIEELANDDDMIDRALRIVQGDVLRRMGV